MKLPVIALTPERATICAALTGHHELPPAADGTVSCACDTVLGSAGDVATFSVDGLMTVHRTELVVEAFTQLAARPAPVAVEVTVVASNEHASGDPLLLAGRPAPVLLGAVSAPVFPLTTEQAHAIFDVLVREVGESRQWRSSFVSAQTARPVARSVVLGELGHTGWFVREVVNDRERWRVTCSSSRMTAVRAGVVARANLALDELAGEWLQRGSAA